MLGSKFSPRKFGFECEIARGARGALHALHEAGLAADDRLHEYHCPCSSCDPWRSNYPITGQRDCTVDGELISKVLTYGESETDETLTGLAGALVSARAVPDLNAGFHVHVDRRDMEHADDVRLYRMFLRYQDDLAELASTTFGDVRDYNRPLSADWLVAGAEPFSVWSRRTAAPSLVDAFWNDHPDEVHLSYHAQKSQWLNRSTHDTYEFRLWNSTRSEWRMRLAVGVSVAMVNAAVAGENVTRDDERTLLDVLTPYLDADIFAALVRQSFHVEESNQ